MSRIIKCIAIDGPCKDRQWESYSHDVNVKLRGRGNIEHQYRMSAAYPDPERPVEYIYNDPQHVKPVEDAADPIARLPSGSVTTAAPAGTVTDPAPVPDREAGSVTNNGPDVAPLPVLPGTKLNPL